jgi:radical SAM protein with 4Fe4S-binding SPASM domain
MATAAIPDVSTNRTRVRGRRGMQSLPDAMAVPDFGVAPLLVLWAVTRACELACTHCRASADPRRDPLELSGSESEELLRQIRDMGTPLVVLTGGDPLLREDVRHLVSYGASLGLRMTMTPSVTPRLTPEAIAALAGEGLCRMAFSLDSADAAVHDGMRGVPGTFDRTLALMRHARSLGLSTQVNTTVTNTTIGSLAQMPALLESIGCDLWSVFFLVPVGRGGYAEVPDADTQERAFAILDTAARRGAFAVKATEAPHYRRYALRREGADPAVLPMSGVNDGRGVVFVDHRGYVFPSGFLPLAAGNVREDRLASIYRDSPLFRRLRDPDALGGKCGVCEYRKVCGGSRARSYAMTGEVMAAEPCCAYVPAGWDAAPVARVEEVV